MKALNLDIENAIKKLNIEKYLEIGNFGIEKENLRVNMDGSLSLKKHPSVFGEKIKNNYIKSDFSESQIEVITPPLNDIDEVYNSLWNLTNISNNSLEDEYLWPQSSPSELPSEDIIPIADFGTDEKGIEEVKYREFLAVKYGKKLQMISGIHYNFSFKDQFIGELYETIGKDESFKSFKNKIYMKLTKNLLKIRWFLIYLTGTSPAVHETYEYKHLKPMNKTKDYYSFDYSLSLRNGFCGYKNDNEIIVDYDSVSSYIKSINKIIEDGQLTDPREFYSTVRIKGKDNKRLIKSIEDQGINYIEIRSLDLDPLDRNGISRETLYLTHLFVLYSLLIEESSFTEEEQKTAYKNQKLVANNGLAKKINIYSNFDEKKSIEEAGSEILDTMEHIIDIFDLKNPAFKKVIKNSRERLEKRENTLAYRINNGIKKDGYIDFHMNLAQKYSEESRKEDYKLIGYEHLELSTQIILKDSVKRGLIFEVIDESDNFISITNEEKKEYIKQATKTRLDSYISVMIMENKVVTKKILEENFIKVPKGKSYNSLEEARADYSFFKDIGIVIKPKSTNFGIGITIFKEKFSEDSYNEAIDIAFSKDTSIIVEEFISGKEYRFFVIGDKTIGILNRVPANVLGNGIDTIEKLVKEKNKSYLRGKGYKKPLEEIELGRSEEMFLETQNLNFSYIPKKDETIYLRENSNISTGGDSLDYTDEVIDEYKEIAVKAAKAAGAKICGVDIMIQDIKEKPSEKNYAIIELNFNPALHIHCYPHRGVNRNIGEYILRELELI